MSGGLRSDVAFTTLQVAKMLNISSRYVQKRYDDGSFPGAYRLPKTTHRRFPRDSVLQFCRDYGVPVPDKIAACRGTSVLLCGVDFATAHQVSEELKGDKVSVFRAATGFEAGRLAATQSFTIVAVDVSPLGPREAKAVADGVGTCGSMRVLLVPEDREYLAGGFPGAEATLPHPCPNLGRRLRDLLFPNSGA
jgi:hypothetical protein